MVSKTIREYVSRLDKIENEIKLLREDRKDLDAEFKEQLDLKAVKAALRILKIRANSQEDHVEQVLEILGKSDV